MGSKDGNGRAGQWETSLIEAMGVALASKSSKIVRSSLVATGWLTGALRQMPNPGVLSFARTCIVPSLVSILQTAREAEFRVLACLSLHNLIDESGTWLVLGNGLGPSVD